MYAVRRGKVHELGSHWREALEMRERTNDMIVSLYITRLASGSGSSESTGYILFTSKPTRPVVVKVPLRLSED